MAIPKFLVKPSQKLQHIRKLRGLLDDPDLHTVCESAKCPNIGECYAQNTLTFMILGNICTRHCGFCGVPKGRPLELDKSEPDRIAAAVKKLGLKYVVITSVTRDDLPDGGAAQFAEVTSKLKAADPEIRVELLIPDFCGDLAALRTVVSAKPFVLNHNIETVPRLYPQYRSMANYQISLEILQKVKTINPGVYNKSGFMVGLGESRREIYSVLRDLKAAECDIVTIGQYLAPSREHPQPERYLPPEEFTELETFGRELGFLKVIAGPFVRSSYHAADLAGLETEKINAKQNI